MKYIRYINDLHLDFDFAADYQCSDNLWLPEAMEGDEETTLIIAGDLWADSRHLTIKDKDGLSWLQKVAQRFKYVVYVLGNHDYWGGRFDTTHFKERGYINEQGIHNVYLLEGSSVVLDGVLFVGGTLWTNYGRRNPISMMEAPNFMVSDYKKIRVGETYRKLRPEDCLKVFDKTSRTIFKTAKEALLNEDIKDVVVVTHMAPSHASVHEKYRNPRDELSNTWYYSELSGQITGSCIRYWFHGHMHNACDYVIRNSNGVTRVMCNPRGYVGYEYDTGFNESTRITLEV